ncbi:hypothetical protein BKA56DRAFT_591935 [Ilyonectria sp. MPI-CAGE-AT-0026]|nr:hypothetical protein BKA56DRAFT_591935 [Ilyonectria sp. MPI-CAGE-AT-0026]
MDPVNTSDPDEVASLEVIRLYEIVSLCLFFGGLIYVWRSRNPVFYGVYFASSIGGGVMEWIFDSKYYFRLTTDERFITAWTMAEEKAALAMILFYAFFFGIPLVLLDDHRAILYRKFGYYTTYFLVVLLGTIGTPMFECTNTSVAHIYKYHQRHEYLFYGMPYSNFGFGALMMTLPFWSLEQAHILVKFISRTSLSRWRQKMLACEVGFASVISAFFVAATINGVWYCLAGDVWTPTPRLF